MVTDHIFIFFLRSKLPKVFLFFYFFFFFFGSLFSRNITEFYRVAKHVTSRCVSFNANYFQLKTIKVWKTQEETLSLLLFLLFSPSVLPDSLQSHGLQQISLHHLSEFAHTHVHWVGDAIQLSHPLSSPSPPAFNLSQHQRLLQWIGSTHLVAKVLEF